MDQSNAKHGSSVISIKEKMNHQITLGLENNHDRWISYLQKNNKKLSLPKDTLD